MLAQSFMSARKLGVTELQKQALIKTLVLLETDKLVHAPNIVEFGPAPQQFTGHFNMANWKASSQCGTVACIGGTAELIGGVRFRHIHNNQLEELFTPTMFNFNWERITPSQAARALRSFLTTGEARWDIAIGGL